MNEEVLPTTCPWRDANENRSAGACGFGPDRNPRDSKLVRTQRAHLLAAAWRTGWQRVTKSRVLSVGTSDPTPRDSIRRNETYVRTKPVHACSQQFSWSPKPGDKARSASAEAWRKQGRRGHAGHPAQQGLAATS